jgi:hypothetical protein
MLKSLRKWWQRPARRSSVRPVRLFLERLERRDCPSGPTTGSPPSGSPPTLTFTVSQAGQHLVLITGQVTDQDPSTVVVSFTGVVTASTTASADGTFSIETTASALGAIDGVATDDQAMNSGVVEVNLTNVAPEIVMFQAVEVSGTVWTLSGQVEDEAASGLMVTMGGLPELNGQTVTTDANGNFSLSVRLADGESGTATAQTVDGWAVNSNLAEFYINPA